MKYIYYVAPFALLLLIGFSFFRDISKSKDVLGETNTGLAHDSMDSSSTKKKGRANGKSLFDEDSKFLEFPEIGIEDLENESLENSKNNR